MEFVEAPLRFVHDHFQQDPSGNTLDQRLRQHFEGLFATNELRQQIPSLNHTPLHLLRPNTLVRARGMIQDMLDPEYYLGVYETEKTRRVICGFYQDAADDEDGINLHSSHNQTFERHILYCVPIPGESSWVDQTFSSQANLVTENIEQRETKRRPREEEEDNEIETVNMQISGNEPVDANTKRIRPEATNHGSRSVIDPTAMDLRHPLSNTSKPNFVAKVYNSEHGLKLNEVIEFFGVLTFDSGPLGSAAPNSAGSVQEQLERDFMAGQPSALVPRLHCISFARLSNNNPLIQPINPWTDAPLLVQNVVSQVANIRPILIQYIASIFGGDSLAAEYTLLSLLSSVYGRADVVQIGRFSLNLSGCPPAVAMDIDSSSHPAQGSSQFGSIVHRMVSSLIPKSCMLSLSLSFLNNNPLQPRRNSNTNRLHAAPLQLSDGTHLILDETIMHEGSLAAAGINNVKVLKQLLEAQTVTYDIPFQAMDFNTDVPVLVLSEGKTILPVDCMVRLMPQGVIGTDTMIAPTADFLNAARLYIGICRIAPYSISPNMSDLIEREFVAQRQEAAALNQTKMTQQDLFYELTVARLLAISHGEVSLSPERWRAMRELEKLRRTRSTTISPPAR